MNTLTPLGPSTPTPRYPEKWPKPRADKPNAVQSRVTEQQKEELYTRVISTRRLALELGCSETYLSSIFPGKRPLLDRKALLTARKEYKLEVAKQILEGRYTIRQASKIAHTSYNTMHRNLAKAKLAYPALAAAYKQK